MRFLFLWLLWDDSFKIQEEEVAEIRWFSVDELKDMMRENPDEFVTGLQKLPEELW